VSVVEELAAAGMTERAARRTSALFARVDSVHEKMSDAQPRHLWVPGRIEVLGKHTDYAGGRSLLCAVERGFCVAASPRDDGRVNIVSVASDEQVTATAPADASAPSAHWSNYARVVTRRLSRDFGPLRGADITFASDVPIAAGVSSSSALVTALSLAILTTNELSKHPAYGQNIRDQDALAGYLGAVENGLPFDALPGDHGVGTFGGSEDHTAILRARVGSLVQYRFRPVQCERVIPLPGRYSFIVAATGVRAEKTGAALEAYNRLSILSGMALERWNALTGRADDSLGTAVAACGDDVAGALRATSPELAERAEQFTIETERLIPACVHALERGDVDRFGALVDESMRHAERMLRNQVPETSFLARRARELGAVAASAFGAGFGGSVWAMVEVERAPDLLHALRDSYTDNFPEHRDAAEFFETPAGPPALTGFA
jgi:galactokinase